VTAYQQTMLGLADPHSSALAWRSMCVRLAAALFTPPLTQMRLLHYAPQPPGSTT